ncbi:MAG: PAS domain S-box protein [Rhodospirillales bacterium]|nr:MAG: PAS domain S-box protein [Rhodospirillales bacterium]
MTTDGDAVATASAPGAPVDDAARIAELEKENLKLRKINRALMDRVERSMDAQGSAFSMFQTSVMLGQVVRDRTAALAEVLSDLETSNRALMRARDEAETAKGRLSDAIESVSQAFALFDADDRMVLANSKYQALWEPLGVAIAPGTSFSEIARLTVDRGLVRAEGEAREAWIARRIASHHDPKGAQVYALADGRWVQINERRTRDGGVVSVYTDITDLKQREAEQREQELAQKSRLLQSTLDNLSQGVAVFDGDLRLVAWNRRFFDLWRMPLDLAQEGAPLEAFLLVAASRGEYGLGDPAHQAREQRAILLRTLPSYWERGLDDERVLEMRHHPMPDGGFVCAYTDITGRTRAAEALRDSERRIRLITDAMPALIAYVDADLTYTFTNLAFEAWFGRSRDAINGAAVRAVQGEAQFQRLKPYIDQAMAGQTVAFEIEEPRGDGTLRIARKSYIPHLDGMGKVIGFFVLTHDITGERAAEQALRDAYETLERRVDERTAALTELNRQLSQEVAERRAMEEALRAAKTEAERANLSKTKFLAAASHDLLQPLNAARLFSTALLEKRLSPANRTIAHSIDKALGSVHTLLNALLDISKLDAGAVQVEASAFPLDSLLGELAAEYGGVAAARGLRFRHVPSRGVVVSDPRLLQRIVRNFLSNAIRYTRTGQVMLGCRRRGANLEIGVWDTGPGIAIDKLDLIFEEFRQIDSTAPTDRERGLGLGLAIVERVARILAHPVQVRSWPGHGSVFSVIVPLACGTEVTAAAPAMTARGVTVGARVLVVDDELAICQAMDALLSGWSCRVVSALSADEALRHLAAGGPPPDLVIADYHLGADATGVDAIERVRAATGWRMPALLITADHSTALHREAAARGYPLLNKPVKPAQLRSLVTHLLGSAGPQTVPAGEAG